MRKPYVILCCGFWKGLHFYKHDPVSSYAMLEGKQTYTHIRSWHHTGLWGFRQCCRFYLSFLNFRRRSSLFYPYCSVWSSRYLIYGPWNQWASLPFLKRLIFCPNYIFLFNLIVTSVSTSDSCTGLSRYLLWKRQNATYPSDMRRAGRLLYPRPGGRDSWYQPPNHPPMIALDPELEDASEYPQTDR